MTIIVFQALDVSGFVYSDPVTLPLGFSYAVNTFTPQGDQFIVPVGAAVDGVDLFVNGPGLTALSGGSIDIGNFTESFTVTNGVATTDDGLANAILDAGAYHIVNHPSLANPGTVFYTLVFDTVPVSEPGKLSGGNRCRPRPRPFFAGFARRAESTASSWPKRLRQA